MNTTTMSCQSHNATQGDNVLSVCEVLNRITFVLHVDDLQQRAVPFKGFTATVGLQNLLNDHFQQSEKMKVHCDAKDICAIHTGSTTCPLGELCDELHLSPETTFSLPKPTHECWIGDDDLDLELPLLTPRTPDSPSYSSASSAQCTPGHSVCSDDCDWSYVMNSPLTRRVRRLSFGLDEPIDNQDKPLQLFTNGINEEEYSDFDSEESSEYFATKNWASRPNCAGCADENDDEESRDTDYSDFDSEDSLLWTQTFVNSSGGFGCYNFVEYPDILSANDCEEYFQCFISARWVSDPNCALQPCHDGDEHVIDEDEDRSSDYSDFDSENSLMWQTTGYAYPTITTNC